MSQNKLTKKEISAIAELIRIFIPEEELEEYADQLETALDYTEVFDELDTEETDATAQSIGLINVFRDDSVEDSLPQSDAISNAHNVSDGYVVVQRVVKK